jgi:LmbE family N-acetylglucosaminyl deacetylase
MVDLRKKSVAGWGRVIIILFLLVVIVFASRQLFTQEPSVPVTDLNPLQLSGFQRLLILAPHCDDETLSSAGLILAAQRAGMQVRVVIATNGDGFLFATMQDFRKIYPKPSDFIRMGELRQQESLAALEILGVHSEQVTFLSYPDRGTPDLWNNHWATSDSYRSPYSADTKSPYPITFDPNAVYAGVDYLKDLSSILESYRPDLIIYPHPMDVHPDHWGLNVFTRLAISILRHRDPSFATTELTYLVHRPDFPEIKGLFPTESLTPPYSIYELSPNWVRLDLSPTDTAMKGQAVKAYRSQLPLLHNLLDSFVRANETFFEVTDSTLVTTTGGTYSNPSSWIDVAGKSIPPVQLDPVGDYTTRDLLPAGDLTALFAAQDKGGNLLVCARLREKTVPEIIYMLRMKIMTDNGVSAFRARTGELQSGWQPLNRTDSVACLKIFLSDLGNPWAIFIGATTVTGGRIEDETAWQMIQITQP